MTDKLKANRVAADILTDVARYSLKYGEREALVGFLSAVFSVLETAEAAFGAKAVAEAHEEAKELYERVHQKEGRVLDLLQKLEGK